MSSISKDHLLSQSLKLTLKTRNLYENAEESCRRKKALKTLKILLVAWISTVQQTDDPATIEIIPFGSYRLNAHRPGADIDVLVLSNSISREEFFDSFVELCTQLQNLHEKKIFHTDNKSSTTHKYSTAVCRILEEVGEEVVELQQLLAIQTAYTPVVKFKLYGVALDLLYSQLPSLKSPSSSGEEEFRLKDEHLVDLDDEVAMRSCNGVRVAQFLLEYLTCATPSSSLAEKSSNNINALGSVERNHNFCITLRAVKEWAEVHGLYSNVLGFLGGVNWAIMVAYVCKQYPNSPSSTLLRNFFRIYAHWKWPTPLTLIPIQYKAPLEEISPQVVWNPTNNPRDKAQIMPIITPVWPSMNSSYNVGHPQLRRLQQEFERAWISTETMDLTKALIGGSFWGQLFGSYDFFREHLHFLQVNIIAESKLDYRSWFGFCSSRLRILIAGIDDPLLGVEAYPFAKFYENNFNDEGERNINLYSSSLYIALRFGNGLDSVDLWPCAEEFLQMINSWKSRKKGMDLTIQHLLRHELPLDVLPASERNDLSEAPKVCNKRKLDFADLSSQRIKA